MSNPLKNVTECPLCGLTLPASGELLVDDVSCVVYQCERCTRRVTLFGETIDVALTFVRDTDGNAVDPADGTIIRRPA